jgi:hypothetical protein
MNITDLIGEDKVDSMIRNNPCFGFVENYTIDGDILTIKSKMSITYYRLKEDNGVMYAYMIGLDGSQLGDEFPLDWQEAEADGLVEEKELPEDFNEDELDSRKQNLQESVNWSYFDKFRDVIDKFMPDQGEGETYASQIATAINKLVYKWYNDGDVYDNSCYLEGWANDLSDYANWLAKNVDGAKDILDNIFEARNDSDYENILKALADNYLSMEFLDRASEKSKTGSIYDCAGDYSFDEHRWDEDEDDYWEDDYDEDEEDEEDY